MEEGHKPTIEDLIMRKFVQDFNKLRKLQDAINKLGEAAEKTEIAVQKVREEALKSLATAGQMKETEPDTEEDWK